MTPENYNRPGRPPGRGTDPGGPNRQSGSANAAGAGIGTVITLETISYNPGTGSGNTNFSRPFTFSTQFVDTSGGLPGVNISTVNFRGILSGAAQSGAGGGIGATSVVFSQPSGVQTFTAANTRYTVNYTTSFGPSANGPGELRALVTATVVPEPTSVVLMGIGGVGVLGLYWRRRLRPAA